MFGEKERRTKNELIVVIVITFIKNSSYHGASDSALPSGNLTLL